MENQDLSALDRLKQLVRTQKTIEFPDVDSSDPEIQSASERLMEYDQSVSTLVIQAIQGKQIDLADIQMEQGLTTELLSLRQQADPEAAKSIDKMIKYKTRLDSMLELVKEIAERGHP